MNEEQEYIEYITQHCECRVCGEGFDDVDDAMDAGTDLFVHRRCRKQWGGCWLNGDINPNMGGRYYPPSARQRRETRAKNINGIKEIEKGIFEVESASNPNQKYKIVIADNSCTCPDKAKHTRRYDCKHLIAVKNQ